MRVISGKARHIILTSKDPRTVPLSDRAKTALFNIIQEKIPGSTVLDLYAGSGALGIECLSREAEFATFVDISNQSFESIEENLRKTKLIDQADVFRMDCEHYEKKFPHSQFDIIFVCPPYREVKFHVVKLASQLLAPGGILIFEHNKKDLFKPLENLEKIDDRIYGIVQFEIYQHNNY